MDDTDDNTYTRCDFARCWHTVPPITQKPCSCTKNNEYHTPCMMLEARDHWDNCNSRSCGCKTNHSYPCPSCRSIIKFEHPKTRVDTFWRVIIDTIQTTRVCFDIPRIIIAIVTITLAVMISVETHVHDMPPLVIWLLAMISAIKFLLRLQNFRLLMINMHPIFFPLLVDVLSNITLVLCCLISLGFIAVSTVYISESFITATCVSLGCGVAGLHQNYLEAHHAYNMQTTHAVAGQ